MEKLVFHPVKQVEPEKLSMGESSGKRSFGCNGRYLEKDGEPWLPVMGEFHFTRYDYSEWETELLKMKAAGIDIVSSYIFWIFHEEEEGKFRFDGSRNIAYFLELCHKHGLYAFVRIGPWCHGECRNGGFPDWLQHSGIPLRCNDDRYLRYVRRLFSEYAREIKPYLFSEGGSVIGIQLENELSANGAHLARLKEIALQCGLHAPYYTVTGWGPRVTEFPEEEVLPVFGCYPAAPWEGHTAPLGVNKNYFFSTVRNDSSIGSDRISGKASEDESILKNLPHLTCELGPGNQVTYHRRPTITAMDVTALAAVSLGSGNCLPGYYMFHGGFNPPEGLYQESIASGYSNDLPVSSYDFQAPLDEYGQPRESYFYLKALHRFVHCCGKSLASMTCTAPDRIPESLADTKTPRMFLRSDSDSGYLFFNTHQRNYPLPSVEGLTVDIEYASSETKSYGPFDIPSGVCGVFPMRRRFQGLTIEFMTLLPLWEGVYEDIPTLVFSVQHGITPFIEIQGSIRVASENKYAISTENGNTLVRFEEFPETFSLTAGNIRIIVLNEEDMLHFYPVETPDGTKLIFRDGIVFTCDEGIFSYEKTSVKTSSDAVIIKKAENTRIRNENIYSGFLFASADECPEYVLEISEKLAESCFDAIFYFDVIADVIQLYADDVLIADDFLRGSEWRVSLRRILPYIKEGKELRIKCSPIKADRNIYLDTPAQAGISEPQLRDIQFADIVKIG